MRMAGRRGFERARELVRQRIQIAAAAWSYCDELVANELQMLSSRGTAASCGRGCSHCCREEIRVAKAEAEAAKQYIDDTWDAASVETLKHRLRAWLKWYTTHYPRMVEAGASRHEALYEYGPQCAVLRVDTQECGIYPARPLTCRRHYVSSPPDACRQLADAHYLNRKQEPLASVVTASEPARKQLEERTAAAGAEYFQTAHLLVEWLAHLYRVEIEPWRRTPPLFER